MTTEFAQKPDDSQPSTGHGAWSRRRAAASSIVTSLCVHIVVLTILSVTIQAPKLRDSFNALVASTEPSEELAEVGSQESAQEFNVVPVETMVEVVSAGTGTGVLVAAPETSVSTSLEPLAIGLEAVGRNELLQSIGSGVMEGLAGRSEVARRTLVGQRGGTPQSEASVESGLAWLAAHQLADGSWNFDHRLGACQGRCRDPGELGSAPLGATALALLPFLGAGQTHLSGKYQANVAGGLRYLVANMRGGSLMDGGNMYSHGIATIALCEALALTQDRSLAAPAQAAIGWIVEAQDPAGGGWRYVPRMPGDTSVTGWQIMALKSAHLSYLRVPRSTVERAFHFLDLVQADDGAAYGYVAPGEALGTTSVGLLCRMYGGWDRYTPGLVRGVERLAREGPSPANMYYNYYATQVLHHYDDPELWKPWNEAMREQLIGSQSNIAHEAGSWYFGAPGHDTNTGGRLYMTAMCVMTLEVYYRYLPLYKREVIQDDFERELGESGLKGGEDDKTPREKRSRRIRPGS